ncbi:DUF3888 domain-containing protein [Paenibacillus sp. Soil522]|uniref:DUF3888 domain-containing protein n=1 Tax=Paenibacillus sp. Soil522 TaxID=1736388 RepID=UPI0006FC6396|nr:DUF3888 domain-containing protein [Paenibacillus sp. Soil522]KRE31601.1 hypothetical protein ASG81_25045 [Paenibacillus sp. Soil522]
MKKLVKYSLPIAFLVLASVTQALPTHAEPKENTVYKTTYATTENIFLDTIHPELNKFVLNKYGSLVPWADSNIVEIKRLVSPTKFTYQVKIIFKVFGEGGKDWGIDQITLNYDSHYHNKELKDPSLKPEIELVEYQHVIPIPK